MLSKWLEDYYAKQMVEDIELTIKWVKWALGVKK